MASSDLSVGLSGLLVSQRALQTIGHNIANVNTPGFSRQTVSLVARTPDISEFGPIGAGVTINQIQRIKDDLLDSQINEFTSLLGSAEVQNDTFQNLEAIFNELSESSLNNRLENFFGSIQQLSTNPELTSIRFQLLQDSLNLVNNGFNSLNERFRELKIDISKRIETKVSELNSITSEIALLNKRINEIESSTSNSNANDMLDKRDNLVNKLSKLADIRVISNNRNGSIDILLGGTLVVSGNRSETVSTSIAGQGIAKIQGISTANLNSGELKGLLNMQDTTIPKYMQDLDTLAASLIKEINNIHSEGVGLSGGFTSLTSTNAVNSATDSLASTGLPFAPSVTTYTTGTVTSVNGGSTSTVTGSGTAFTSNVKANDWIKLSDGNYYKVLSVTNDTTLTVEGGFASASVATNITNGSLYVTITNNTTGEITKTSISIASDETLNSLAAKLDGITNLNASVSSNLLTITSNSGYKYSFTKALDTNPGNIGSAKITLSGNYSGNDNDIYTLNVQDVGTGSIGTGSAVIRVTDASEAVVADLDVGSSYTAGDVLQIADGVSISFGSGAIVVNQKLTFDVTNDPDTSNMLTALGINTFFAGKDASTIAVTQYIKDDVTRIAAASTASQGDNTNALRLVNLQNIATTNNSTFGDFLHGTVAQLGIETAEKASEKESFNSLLTNLENRRQEVSGVSIEEEMINTIRFQQAFQASARYISVISELSNILMEL
ncbi:MAG: flagellar hook-associated protein FlgK [Candidatus Scalindua rubra]|uniref:Flagellar hook-associated protein 1 n=1 Tax=Candidatus Scalindua rubra TaxID=1872076 RepID=A0A1E3X990_9BACT|nr:MAG: flagellar hook-associated protein FlgK [Candidatus Scalindua rubra]